MTEDQARGRECHLQGTAMANELQLLQMLSRILAVAIVETTRRVKQPSLFVIAYGLNVAICFPGKLADLHARPPKRKTIELLD